MSIIYLITYKYDIYPSSYYITQSKEKVQEMLKKYSTDMYQLSYTVFHINPLVNIEGVFMFFNKEDALLCLTNDVDEARKFLTERKLLFGFMGLSEKLEDFYVPFEDEAQLSYFTNIENTEMLNYYTRVRSDNIEMFLVAKI